MAFFSFISLLCLFTTSGAYSTLSDYTLQNLPSPGTDYNIHTGKLLAPILIPRVPGTEGSVTVLNHFASFFRTNLPDWSLEFQNSTAKTPVTGDKDVPFVNLIATRDPPEVAPGEVSRLTLVAHYDSKLTPEGFIGAIDSAAPCAMLMHAARSVDAALSRKWGATEIDMEDFTEAKGVQIIFLDGEEAFHKWTDSDSLYGARSLAEAWEQTPNPAFSTFHNPLASISLFLLLDLLGAKGSKIPSYFKTTHWAYQKMAALESRLRALGLFKSSPNHSSKRTSNGQTGRRDEPMFLVEADKSDNRFLGWMVQDDHVPFMARGVEVLHMIPTPFPSVWHQMTDDGEHLDLDTVEDWGQLVTAFVGEWMDLEGYFDDSGPVSEALEQKKALHERGGAPTGKTEL